MAGRDRLELLAGQLMFRGVTRLGEQQRSGMDASAWQRSVEPYISRAMATGRYPMVAQFVTRASDLSSSQLFAAGLDAVITGIGAAISADPPGWQS